ncbi:MAG: phosphohydrolase, partial [Actinobacteria bacterium]|nr:phosphohydrolase [Actinomycetota bacterium]
FADHPNYGLTEEFCAEFDQVAFDPSYNTEPLEHFEPLLRDLMAKPLTSIYRRA